ncbi:glycosyltransferase family 2 protein [Orrella marina]|uniref:Glycosyltransferase n=1 Tax=Orrella marina TaxID=2163011 RepID=A0A2R4XP73_9BURK|nr:glycosyltransferase family 2 protein [Orrella marina]AWB35558.1 glycosyltransferase [Orrella marina]
MKFALAAIVKDERDSILEWLAFHRVMGASHFFIADNASTDGTRECLAALALQGWLTLIDFPGEPGIKPQLPAYQRILAQCRNLCDVVAFIDADEYLLPLQEQSDQGLVPWLETVFSDDGVGAVAVNWACFGSGGAKFRDVGLIIERFTQRAPHYFGPNRHFKSIVRPDWVQAFGNPHYARLKRGRYVNAEGSPLEIRIDKEGKQRSGLSQSVCWKGARLNHYLVRSVEEFVLGKARRGSAATPGYNKQRTYFEKHDRNDEVCELALPWVPKVKAELAILEKLVGQAPPHLPNVSPQATESKTPSKQSVFSVSPPAGKSHRGSHSTSLISWFKRKLPGGEPASASPVLRFELDYPSVKRDPFVTKSGRVVQGWLLLHPELEHSRQQLKIIAEWNSQFELEYPFNVSRPDVITQILEADPENHAQLTCGFSFTVPLQLRHFRLWLDCEGERFRLPDVHVEDPSEYPDRPKVLKGEHGWLFLDNDTNGSVDQFTGHMRLSTAGLTGWQDYFTEAGKLASKLGVPWALLIAPSKESILGNRYHPRKPGTAGPIDQVRAISATHPLVYPDDTLRDLGEEAFIPTDTHWSHRGAMHAALELAGRLGVNVHRCKQAFEKDVYALREMGGDLGNKLTPRQSSKVQVLTSFNHVRQKKYDNGLPNFGRLIVTEYPKALNKGTLVLFGSSSSYAMFNHLVRIFKRIVFVHSAGNIDPFVVQQIKPSFLAAQTNGRFVIMPPTVGQSLRSQIQEKIERLTPDERKTVETRRIIAEPGYLQEIGLEAFEEALVKAWGEKTE